MAFFKFRKGGDDKTKTAAQPESVEVLRRRAKNRLVGSIILVLLGVIGFPLLVDKQPRPVQVVDLPIEIPDRNKVLPLTAPVTPAPAGSSSELAPAPATQAQPPADAAPPAATSASGRVNEASPPAKAQPKSAPPASKPAAKAVDSKSSTKAVSESRFVVQVGAFATEKGAREVRLKLERAGLKNYIQVVETREGRRIRVRAGPFASKAEAARAAEKIKKLDLPVTVLTL
jgi:DedD protein